jgi:preprotein translocase subunit SecG
MNYVLMILLLLTAFFLIILVLVQRGKGGGLAGAFGGLGGQSAFGTKAGDLFTRITIGVAGFWILLCVFAVWQLGRSSQLLDQDMGGGPPNKGAASAPATPGGAAKGESGTPQTPAAPAEGGNSGA